MQLARQSTRHVLLVRPHAFGPNRQTAASNAFQQPADAPLGVLRARACSEFDALVAALEAEGAAPIVFEDTDEPAKPDAVFPNNWISTHADGRVFLYPMASALRRAERRVDIVEALGTDHGFRVDEIVDLAPLADEGLYLEGTGSMVLDRVNRVAYAALSSRTRMDPLAEFGQQADCEVVAFDALDAGGLPIYHTNVMMTIGTAFAVVCARSIANETKRADVLARLAATGRDVIEISPEQMSSFAGNMLELRDARDEAFVVMSGRAHASLDGSQRERLAACGRLLAVDVPTIERVGGGSVRCMLAEVFLPRRSGSGDA